jgi:hypothetical protein
MKLNVVQIATMPGPVKSCFESDKKSAVGRLDSAQGLGGIQGSSLNILKEPLLICPPSTYLPVLKRKFPFSLASETEIISSKTEMRSTGSELSATHVK